MGRRRTIVAAPNDPDNIKLLSEVMGDRIQEVFIGSCMTNIGYYRAAAKVLEGQPELQGGASLGCTAHSDG